VAFFIIFVGEKKKPVRRKRQSKKDLGCTQKKNWIKQLSTSPFLQSLSVRFFFEKSEKPFLRQIVYFERRVCVVPRLQ